MEVNTGVGVDIADCKGGHFHGDFFVVNFAYDLDQ
jgi:hypothetical protein